MELTKYAKIAKYIDTNSLAVLGTVNDDGSPNGAVVYVCTDEDRPTVYFVTKNGTQKYKNLLARPAVSLTIVNPAESSTLQAQGQARVTQEPTILDMITAKITRIHAAASDWLPPVTKIRAGEYTMIAIDLTNARLAEFRGKKIGEPTIFTEA